MADQTSGSGTPITLRDFGKTFNRPTDEIHVFTVKKFHGHVLDVEDVHFHFDSAVLMPDFGDCGESADPADQNRVTGLAAIAAVYRHAKMHSDWKILIAGHTDREGRDSYNLGLSRLRAENVLHVLEGKKRDWVAICRRKHRVEDYQQVLRWMHVVWEWDCDPGEVDNDLGPKTRAAVRQFQTAYNRGQAPLPDGFSADISVDGLVGEQTWGAIFDVYVEVLKVILEVEDEGLRARQGGLSFLDDTRKTVGCGEHHPITKNPVVDRRRLTADARKEIRRLARVDRRVEILFFEPGEEPLLEKCHPDKRRCVFGKCEIYKAELFELDPLPCDGVDLRGNAFILELSDDVKIPEDAVLVVDGLKNALRLPVKDHYDDEMGVYTFVLRPTVPGSSCSAVLETSAGSVTLFEGVDLDGFVERAAESESEPPVSVDSADELIDHLEEVEEEVIDDPVPEGEEGDWEFPDEKEAAESGGSDDPSSESDLDPDFDTSRDN